MMHKLCKFYNIACILIPEAESYENTMSVLRVVHTQVFSFFNSHLTKRTYPPPYELALECQKLLYDILCISFIVSYNPIVFSYMWNHQICSHYQGFVTHFRFTADEKFYPWFFLYQHQMRLSILVGVPWNIFGIQGWLVPENAF